MQPTVEIQENEEMAPAVELQENEETASAFEMPEEIFSIRDCCAQAFHAVRIDNIVQHTIFFGKRRAARCKAHTALLKLEIVEVEDEKTSDRASEAEEDQIREKEAERVLKYVNCAL